MLSVVNKKRVVNCFVFRFFVDLFATRL